MSKKIILTGDRPTGKLHLGHYTGSLKTRAWKIRYGIHCHGKLYGWCNGKFNKKWWNKDSNDKKNKLT